MKKIIAGIILVFIIGVSFTEMRLFGPGGYDLRQFFFTFRDDTDTIMRISTQAGVKVNSSLYSNVDSVTTITNIGSDYYLVLDVTTGKFKKILASNTEAAILFRSSTTTATSGTDETDLFTYTTPANTLNADNEFLEYDVEGLINVNNISNSNLMRVRVYWAGTEVAEIGATTSAAQYYTCRVRVIRTSSSNARVSVAILSGAVVLDNTVPIIADVTTTFTNTNIIKITGESTDATKGVNAQIGTLKRWR